MVRRTDVVLQHAAVVLELIGPQRLVVLVVEVKRLPHEVLFTVISFDFSRKASLV